MSNDYKTLIGLQHLEKLWEADRVCFDTETLQLQPEQGKLRLLQLGCPQLKLVVVIDFFELNQREIDMIAEFFQHKKRVWLAHNAVFDLGWLQEYSIYPLGIVECSMIASQLLGNGLPNLKHGLGYVAKRFLDVSVDKEQQTSDWSAKKLTEEQLVYAAKDVEILCELQFLLRERIINETLHNAFQIECSALQAMAQMWRTGLYWNRKELEKVHRDYKTDIINLGRDFLMQLDKGLPKGHKLERNPDNSFNTNPKTVGSIKNGTKVYAGFNLNSPKQLLEKFTLLLGTAPIDQKTGRPSASRTALREYAGEHIAVATYLQWKKAEKRRQMVESLLEKMDFEGVVRASYMQLGAETGRMTCFKPNLMQIPRDEQFRSSVVAPDGWLLVDADFSQMELRLAAVIAGDENMMQAFKDGKDLHDATAEALGCSRQIAKSANFGLLYGSGAKGLKNYAAGMGVKLTEKEATNVRDKWLKTYSGIKKWHSRLSEFSNKKAKNCYIRVPRSKMRRFLPGEMNRLTVRANTPVQGAGAAILKLTLCGLWEELRKYGEEEAVLCGCVHDEILLLVRKEAGPKWAKILKQAMEKAESIWLGDVPAVADVHIGTNWAEVH